MSFRIHLKVERNPGILNKIPIFAKRRNEQLAEITGDIARSIVAVDTGATKRSIEVQGNEVSAGEAAIYLEFGTVKMDAQPFLRPAARLAKSTAKANSLFGL